MWPPGRGFTQVERTGLFGVVPLEHVERDDSVAALRKLGSGSINAGLYGFKSPNRTLRCGWDSRMNNVSDFNDQ